MKGKRNRESKNLTSVQIDKVLYRRFKEKCLEDNFSLRELTEKSIYLYLTDESYKKDLLNQELVDLVE